MKDCSTVALKYSYNLFIDNLNHFVVVNEVHESKNLQTFEHDKFYFVYDGDSTDLEYHLTNIYLSRLYK